MTHDEDLFLVKAVPKIVHHVQRVLFHLWHIQRPALLFFVIRRVGLACSPLIPLHHGEVLLPRAWESPSHGNKCQAGTAMDKQENRVVYALAPHFDPLINTADSHTREAVNTIG